MSAQLHGPQSEPSDSETADFSLSAEEIAKGERAALSYLETVKAGDTRRGAEEALDILAAVISGGVCGGIQFPWHQVRAYHGALAISIVKEKGAPGQIEALRCRHDHTRRYQQMAENFKPREIQRMQNTLHAILSECGKLGFISEDDMELALHSPTEKKKASNGTPREREVTHGEVRAMVAACAMGGKVTGARDALILSLAWQGCLKTVDLINLTVDNLHFDQKTGQSVIRHKAAGQKRSKRIELQNEDLISLEDWLEARGREPGPLFCPVSKDSVKIKRISAAEMKELCAQRADEAGVLPFAPNDISRSSPFNTANRKKRKGKTGPEDQQASVLFPGEGSGQSEGGAERISFPYRVRVSR
ncbi:MAG: hypothetical protein CBC48_04010 [bacterium TMED88]|nr:hypothetical protein [Deltaproteobacteria bacterium]OUV35433.1 MAG: hypothetical protein CBC48_04010 [bacterium TMED88]